MRTNRWRQLSMPILVAGFAAPTVIGCGSIPKPPGLPDVPGGCPDVASVEAIAKIDFAQEFGFDVQGAAKVKSALTAFG